MTHNCYECVWKMINLINHSCLHPGSEAAHQLGTMSDPQFSGQLTSGVVMMGPDNMPMQSSNIMVQVRMEAPESVRNWPKNFHPLNILECDGFKPTS